MEWRDPKVKLHRCHNVILALGLQKALPSIVNRSNHFLVWVAPSGTLLLQREGFPTRTVVHSGAWCHQVCLNDVCIHLEMFTFAHGTTIHSWFKETFSQDRGGNFIASLRNLVRFFRIHVKEAENSGRTLKSQHSGGTNRTIPRVHWPAAQPTLASFKSMREK